MTENEAGTIIVDAAVAIHRRTGPGLLESVYEAILVAELRKQILTYLRLSGCKLGYLLNFGAPLMKSGIFRCANGV